MQPNKKTSKAQTAALFTGLVIISILYFSFPCHRYLSDGLKAAIQMRDSGGLYVHPNHTLYPLLPGLIYRALGGEIFSGIEIEILLLWSMLAGIVACAGLVLSLRARSLSVAATLISLGLFAFFKAVWYLSVIPSPSSNALAAQVCGFAAIVLVSRSLPAGPSRTGVAIMSVFSALAVLGSQLNAVLMPVAAVVIYLGAKPKLEKHKDLFVFLAITLAIVLGVSIVCGAALADVRSLGGFIMWQHSYVYDSRWWIHGLNDAIYRNWAGLNESILAFPFRLDNLYGNWMIEFPEPNFWWRLLIRSGQALAMIFLFIETVRAAMSYIKGTVRTFIQTVGLIAALPDVFGRIRQQRQDARAFYSQRQSPLMAGASTGAPPGVDLPLVGDESTQHADVFVIDLFDLFHAERAEAPSLEPAAWPTRAAAFASFAALTGWRVELSFFCHSSLTPSQLET